MRHLSGHRSGAMRGIARTRFGASLLVLCLLLIAGCRGEETGGDVNGKKTVRLFILFLSTQQNDFYRWAEQTFEARNPGTDIIIEQFPGSSLKDFEIKLRLRFASRHDPDLVMANENVIAPLAKLGLMDRAPSYIVERVQTNSLNEMARQAPYVDGVCYGIATDAAWQVLFYNKDHFREVGLDPERPPQTWDELIQYADKLTVRDRAGNVIRAGFSLRKTGFKPGTAEKWYTFLLSAGGRPYDEAGTRAMFNSEEGRRALDLYRTILDRKIDAVTHEGDQPGFGQGTVSMFYREVHVIRWLRETHPEMDFGVAPLPRGPLSISSGGAYTMSVSKRSKHRDVAWRFIEFLTSDEAYSRYVGIGGVLPMIKSVAESPVVQQDTLLQVFLKQPVASVGHFPHVQRAAEVTGAYFERFIYGLMTRDEFLAKAERDVNAILAANKTDE
ncbi:MAG TPA: extracellular solute-binding protein [Rhodothermales bacterium]|nr:extracellular solute-binding protein [Rhodothermales bacterium]